MVTIGDTPIVNVGSTKDMDEPPPITITKSTCAALAKATARRTVRIEGLFSTSSKIAHEIPKCCSLSSIARCETLILAEWCPVTSNAFFP